MKTHPVATWKREHSQCNAISNTCNQYVGCSTCIYLRQRTCASHLKHLYVGRIVRTPCHEQQQQQQQQQQQFFKTNTSKMIYPASQSRTLEGQGDSLQIGMHSRQVKSHGAGCRSSHTLPNHIQPVVVPLHCIVNGFYTLISQLRNACQQLPVSSHHHPYRWLPSSWIMHSNIMRPPAIACIRVCRWKHQTAMFSVPCS